MTVLHLLSMTKLLADRIAVARGTKKADLVLRGGTMVNVVTGEQYQSDVAVHHGTIAGIGSYDGKKVFDVSSKYVLPGFIDSHVHLESTMLTPAEFAKAALLHGTTAVVADPHEIANVLGRKGIEYLLKASEGLLLDFYFMLPSCVPATDRETSGARLEAADLKPFLKHPRVLGLAEMMNYQGLLSADRSVLKKLKAFQYEVIDGHAPGLSGKDLSAYISAGVSSDHECTTAEEAREKVRLGMTVFIREGSSAKNLEALLPAVTPLNAHAFAFATDDLVPDDLAIGGINLLVRKAVRLGLDPVSAIRMATINPARHFNLKGKGAVLPGYDADIVVVDDLKNCAVELVIKSGIPVTGRSITGAITSPRKTATRNSVHIKRLNLNDLRIKARSARARVIELVPGQIETKEVLLPVLAKDGLIISDTVQDVLKLLVVERHRASGNIGKGLVKGLGLSSGAIASTVAHDSHNLIAAGVRDEDILMALETVRKMHGGLAVVDQGKVLASLPLPIAGLISDRPLDFVVTRLEQIQEACRRLGSAVDHPFGILSFLALPVIPELKLTDKGLVDVRSGAFVDLFI